MRLGALLRFWWAPVIAGLLVLAGVERVRGNNARAALAGLRATVADDRTRAAQAAQRAEAAARDEEARRDDESRKVVLDAKEQTKRAQGDAAAAAVAADRLRGQLAVYVARARGGAENPAAASGGAPSAVDLLSDMFGRLDEAAGRYSVEADSARIAGNACASAYDSLTARAD